MAIPFEPTRSYVYKATRYEILPRIVELARPYGDVPFLLRDLSKKVLNDTYTREQLDIQIRKAQSDVLQRMSRIFGFYIPFLAKNLRIFERVGDGMFRNVSNLEEDEEIAEADADPDAIADEEAGPVGFVDTAGFIYMYSFPTIVREGVRFPIKIGLTRADDADARVQQQCRQTCCFENPTVLRTWKVQQVAAVEQAIHSILRARGRKRDAPGTEWFDTTLDEVESIVKFVQETG
ncbi:MAG: GIY-YIG nuclease family protein [Alphaproteobacteria bacterium]|nr:GIY-YIG nuclease family protein [Alphaproteobacteria bacterium]MCW5743584.1 GIY-YIG nuclease family protein [Alphaproteobacteria bacterium]